MAKLAGFFVYGLGILVVVTSWRRVWACIPMMRFIEACLVPLPVGPMFCLLKDYHLLRT